MISRSSKPGASFATLCGLIVSVVRAQEGEGPATERESMAFEGPIAQINSRYANAQTVATLGMYNFGWQFAPPTVRWAVTKTSTKPEAIVATFADKVARVDLTTRRVT